jgi:Tfp pilus assembly protein PilX
MRKRLSSESGLALAMALIVVAALSVATASLITLVTSSATAVGRDRQEERAFNIAEAGLNEAVSYLSKQDTLSISAVAWTDYSLDNGTGQWSATKTASSTTVDTWTLYAKATSGKSTRQVSVKLAANKTVSSTPVSGAWGMGFFVADPSSCAIMSGTGTVQISVFAAGNLCLNGNQQITEPTPTTPSVYLYVGGQVQLTGGNAAIGTSAAMIAQADIVGGCTMNGNAKICSNSAQSKVFAKKYISTAQSLTKPPVDAPGIYAGGDWNHPVCSTGSFTFDGNGTRDSSVGDITILPGSAYNCTVYKSSSHVAGNEMGSMSWNPGTKALTVSGTLYLDGNLVMTGGNADYTGTGTIYVNGRVAISGNGTVCGPGATSSGSTCTGKWNGALGVIAIVVVNSGGVTGFTSGSCTSPGAWSMSGNAEIDVMAYIVGCYKQTGTSYVTGPVTTDQGIISGTPTHTDIPNPPPNVPGASGSTTIASWGHVLPSSWRQCTATTC